MKEEFNWRDYDSYNEWLHDVLETLNGNIKAKDKEIERLHSIIKEVRNCNLKDISILKTRKDMSNEEMIMRLKATNMILDKENI